MVVAHVRLEDGGTYSVTYGNSTDDNDVGAVVDCMRVTSSSNFVAFNRASWLRFVAEFGQNPALSTLRIEADRHSDNGGRVIGSYVDNNFNVETLAQIIEAVTGEDPTKIKHFNVFSNTLTGAAGPDDGWERFNRSIRIYFRALERFSIGKYWPKEDEEPQLLEPMVQAIFSLPTLRKVLITLPRLTLSPTTLQNLGRCQDLEELDIAETEQTELKDEHIMALANALQSTRRLNHLEVQVSNRLEDPGACGRAMSGMLQVMPGPVRVHVYSRKVQEEFHLAFVDVMAAVDTSGIDLTFNCKLSEKALNAYLNIATERYNFLRRFWCNYEDRNSDVMKTLQFNLALNRAGRAKVLDEGPRGKPVTPSRGQWVEVIIQANEGTSDGYYDDDFMEEEDIISTLFYFLSQNPTLCDSANN